MLKKNNVKKRELEINYDVQNHIHKKLILLDLVKYTLQLIKKQFLVRQQLKKKKLLK